MKKTALLLIVAMLLFMPLCASGWQVHAAEDDGDEMKEVGQVEVEGSDEDSEELIEDIEDTGGVIVYSGEQTKAVKLTYGTKIKYENYTTVKFKVECKGEEHVAYCIQPGIKRSETKDREAVVKDMKLLQKGLYYSYGYPGYEEKMKGRMAELDLKKCYAGDNGAYAFAHVLLSYIYQLEGGRSTPFKGVSADTQEIVKALVEEIKEWPDPFSEASLSLSKEHVGSKWVSSEKRQQTEAIELKGTNGNSITVVVPDGAEMIAGERHASAGESVTVKTGESFYFTGGSELTGKYESPEMEGSIETFSPYVIESGTHQDILFGCGKTEKVKFSIDWIKVPENVSITTSAAESKTGNKEVDSKGEIMIADKVSCTGLEPGLEYRVSGRLMDKSTGEETGVTAESTFIPESESGEVIVEFKANGNALAGKSLVAFEKLYFEDKLLATHEDIESAEQSVTIKEHIEETPDKVGTAENGKPGGSPDYNPIESVPAAPPDNNVSSSVPKTGDELPIGIVMVMALFSALLCAKTAKCKR